MSLSLPGIRRCRIGVVFAWALLLTVQVMLSAPADAATTPQWRLLKAVSKRADDGAIAGRSAKSVAGRAKRAFELPSAVPGKKTLVLGLEDDGIRAFTVDGPEEGILFPKAADAVEHYSSSEKSLAVALDPAGEPLDLVREFAGAGFDVGLLDETGERLELREIEVEGEASWHVAASPGLLIPLADGDRYRRTIKRLGKDFKPLDVTLITAAGQLECAALARYGFKGHLELTPDLDHSSLQEGHPILALGQFEDHALGRLLAFAQEKETPLLALNFRTGSLHGTLNDCTVLEFLSRFASAEDPWRYEESAGDWSGVWLPAQSSPNTSQPMALVHGIDSRGMSSPYPWQIIAICFVVLGYLPGQAVGHALAWPLGWIPTTLRGPQLSFLGILPFTPFGEQGCLALMLAGIWIAAAAAIGWVLGWPLRFKPVIHCVPKYALIGSVVMGLFMGVRWALPQIQNLMTS